MRLGLALLMVVATISPARAWTPQPVAVLQQAHIDTMETCAKILDGFQQEFVQKLRGVASIENVFARCRPTADDGADFDASFLGEARAEATDETFTDFVHRMSRDGLEGLKFVFQKVRSVNRVYSFSSGALCAETTASFRSMDLASSHFRMLQAALAALDLNETVWWLRRTFGDSFAFSFRDEAPKLTGAAYTVSGNFTTADGAVHELGWEIGDGNACSALPCWK